MTRVLPSGGTRVFLSPESGTAAPPGLPVSRRCG